MRCFKHAERTVTSSSARVTASWLLNQTQRLAAENMMLRQSTASLVQGMQPHQAFTAESTFPADVCYEVQILTGDAQVRDACHRGARNSPLLHVHRTCLTFCMHQAASSDTRVCIELFEHGDEASSGIFCLEPVHPGLGPVMEAAISSFQANMLYCQAIMKHSWLLCSRMSLDVPWLQIACTGLREVHSIALVLDSGSSKTSWYVEEVVLRAVGAADWTRYSCFTWLHADAGERYVWQREWGTPCDAVPVIAAHGGGPRSFLHAPARRCSVRLHAAPQSADEHSHESSAGSDVEVAVAEDN